MHKPLSAPLLPLDRTRQDSSLDGPPRRGRAAAPLFCTAPRGARQGPLRAVVLGYLQRTALKPGSRGALSVAQSLYAVDAARAEALGARYDFAASAQRDPLGLAARLLAMPSPRAPIAQAAVAALAHAAPIAVQQQVAAILQGPLSQQQKALVLRSLLSRPLVLAILEAHLHELQAINKILEDWGKHLRKLAKLDKVAHARALKQSRAVKEQHHADDARARDFAAHALQGLQLHFAALGVQTGRSERLPRTTAASAMATSRMDSLTFGLGFAEAAEPLQPWPNASLLAALTPPQELGVRLAGQPRGTPGRRIYGQPV